jgi:hypothetical protein
MTVEKKAMGKCSRHGCGIAGLDVAAGVGGVGVAAFMSSILGSIIILE